MRSVIALDRSGWDVLHGEVSVFYRQKGLSALELHKLQPLVFPSSLHGTNACKCRESVLGATVFFCSS